MLLRDSLSKLSHKSITYLLWSSSRLRYYLCMFSNMESVWDHHKMTNSRDAVMSATVNECNLCSSSASYVIPICCFIFIYLSPSRLWFLGSAKKSPCWCYMTVAEHYQQFIILSYWMETRFVCKRAKMGVWMQIFTTHTTPWLTGELI